MNLKIYKYGGEPFVFWKNTKHKIINFSGKTYFKTSGYTFFGYINGDYFEVSEQKKGGAF
jgi:hypothetical protein